MSKKSCTAKSLGVCVGKFRPVTHCIFDMDGTILDTEKVYFQAYSQACAKYDKVFTEAVNEKQLGCPSEMAVAIVKTELDLPITPEELRELYHEYAHCYLAECPFMPGVEKLVNHLHKHNIPIAIATSSSEPGYSIKVEPKKEFFSMFHHTVASGIHRDLVANGKPAPDIFLAAASLFDEKPKPEDCLVFEDAPSGIQGATSAGMQSVLVLDSKLDKELTKNATVIIKSMNEFKPEWFGLPPYE